MRIEIPSPSEAQPSVMPAARRQFDFELPIGVLDDEGRLHRAGSLRKMTGRDEAILADPQNQRNGGKLVTELLASCVVQLGDLKQVGHTVVSNMYSADRNYLLLKLRSVTFGSELQATYKCPSCGPQPSGDPRPRRAACVPPGGRRIARRSARAARRRLRGREWNGAYRAGDAPTHRRR